MFIPREGGSARKGGDRNRHWDEDEAEEEGRREFWFKWVKMQVVERLEVEEVKTVVIESGDISL